MKSSSQYFEWGAPKTGHGNNWNNGIPPAYFTKDLPRTYPVRTAGTLISMKFNATSADFEMMYETGNPAVVFFKTVILEI